MKYDMRYEEVFIQVKSRQRHYNNHNFSRVKIGMQTRESLKEIYKWIHKNTDGDFCIEGGEVGFRDPQYTTLFALSFRHKVAQ